MQSDADADAMTAAILAAFRAQLGAMPLRAELVEKLGDEARPAVQALLFATSVALAGDVNSLEHHETLAMVALLGRSCAVEDLTPSAAHGMVPALVAAFEREGIAIAPRLSTALSVVFLEGFLRGRDELLAARAAAGALRSVEILPVAEGVGLVVVGGDHDDDALGERLEVLAREAFRARFGAIVLADSVSHPMREDLRSAVFACAEVLDTVGVRAVLAGFTGRTPEGLPAFDALPEAIAHARVVGGGERSALDGLRALFRGRFARRPARSA